MSVVKELQSFNPLSYFYSRVMNLVIALELLIYEFQSPIVFLQSGHSLYCGKYQKNLIVSNHLTLPNYRTLRKSL